MVLSEPELDILMFAQSVSDDPCPDTLARMLQRPKRDLQRWLRQHSYKQPSVDLVVLSCILTHLCPQAPTLDVVRTVDHVLVRAGAVREAYARDSVDIFLMKRAADMHREDPAVSLNDAYVVVLCGLMQRICNVYFT